jgi:hypothetical protein
MFLYPGLDILLTRGWEQGGGAPLGGDFVWTSPAALLHPGFNTAIFYPPQGLARGYQVLSLPIDELAHSKRVFPPPPGRGEATRFVCGPLVDSCERLHVSTHVRPHASINETVACTWNCSWRLLCEIYYVQKRISEICPGWWSAEGILKPRFQTLNLEPETCRWWSAEGMESST